MNYLLVNLAVGDIMYSTFMIPSIILRHNVSHPEGVAGRVLCVLLTGRNLAWVGAFASVFTLIAIATERYFVVLYPHGNNGKLTMRKLKVCHFVIKHVVNNSLIRTVNLPPLIIKFPVSTIYPSNKCSKTIL